MVNNRYFGLSGYNKHAVYHFNKNKQANNNYRISLLLLPNTSWMINSCLFVYF